MKVLVINQDADADKLALQSRQMDALGLNWERIGAATLDTITPPTDHKFWRRWHRIMTSSEKVQFASHFSAWQRILHSGQPGLIIEDGILLASGIHEFLNQIAEMTVPQHITIQASDDKKLVSKTLDADVPMRRIYQDYTGSAAYVLFPLGASKMISRAAKVVVAPIDAAISDARDLVSFQADPALATHMDDSDTKNRFALPETVKVNSYNRLVFRCRRINAQLAKGINFLAYRPISVYRTVSVATKWPDLELKK